MHRQVLRDFLFYFFKFMKDNYEHDVQWPYDSEKREGFSGISL